MTNDLVEGIKNLINNPSTSAREQLRNSLWQEIIDAVKGQRTSRCKISRQTFYLRRHPERPSEPMPDYIEWHGIEKDFAEALEELYSELLSKVETVCAKLSVSFPQELEGTEEVSSHDHCIAFEVPVADLLGNSILKEKEKNILKALTGDKTSRKNWIRSTLGIILTNKVFEEQIRSYKSKERYASANIRRAFHAQKFANIEAIHEFVKGSLNHEVCEMLFTDFKSDPCAVACWALFNASSSSDDRVGKWVKDNAGDVIEWVGNNLNISIDETEVTNSINKIKNKLTRFLVTQDLDNVSFVENRHNEDDEDDRSYEDPIHYELAKAFWNNYFSELNQAEKIDWQEEAFFWRPGEEFRGVKLEGNKSNRAIYIAFFYSWLRRCSGATWGEIANEAGVSITAPSRDWKPHPELESPFCQETGIFCPVYFSDGSRRSIGMYDKRIRCYQGKEHDGMEYGRIYRRKRILWSIYSKLLVDADTLDFLEMSDDKNDQWISKDKTHRFCYEIRSAEDLGMDTKWPCSVVYIKSIGVDYAREVNNNKDSNRNSE